MNFQDLHELLRLEVLRRIEIGALTRTRLAEQAGFRQSHISNFLNRKRALSLEGLDRVLAAQRLTVDQILPLAFSAASAASPQDLSDVVPLVSATTAMDSAAIPPEAVLESIHVASSRLQDNRTRRSPRYAEWHRFVAIRADAQQAAAMDPVLSPGAVVVIDRHYNSLAPYRAHQQTLYAVRCGAGLALRYVEFDDGRLIFRPLAKDFPVQLMALGTHESPADYIVGRVCMVVAEF
jgi:hypothetical protein